MEFIKVNHKNYEKYKKEFISIYQNIFSQAPYFEIFTEDEVEVIYNLSLFEKNILLLALNNNQIVGFALGVQLSKYNNNSLKQLLSKKFNLDDILYNAELGVVSEYRGMGIGNNLILKRIEFAQKNNYKIVCMRTKKEGSMSMSLYKKLGFKFLKDSEHIVNTKKSISGIEDVRVILYKRINS